MAITQDEREFFIALGSRMAEQRKRLNITQMQMAETLSVSQQTVNAYASGQRRVPVSMLPLLAHTLGMGLEELLGSLPRASAGQLRPCSGIWSASPHHPSRASAR